MPSYDLPENEQIETRIKHPCFPQPINTSLPVWRYMDFAKFVSLLKSKSIYLSRVDSFNDPYEGTTTEKTLAGVREHLKRMGSIQEESSVLKILDTRQELFVSCWHANEHESEAMWRLYSGNDSGIAIQSTYSCLLDAVRSQPGVFIGQVKYIDYKTTVFPDANVFYPVMHKRASFMHEREIRLVKHHPKPLEGNQDLALSIPVELNSLCKAIYVAPNAPNYYFEAVKAVVEAISPELTDRLKWSEMTSPPLKA